MSEIPRDVTGRPVAPRTLDLDTFFRPRTVAVIGASDTPRRPTTAMYEKISAWAEAAGARVFPVNPNRDEIDGVTCHRSVLDVPADVDLAVILVGDALPALEETIEKKARFAVVFAAGFAEVGAEGEKLQRQLEELVAGSDLHLLGPNTNLNAFEQFRDDLPGRSIALITQSGHQGRPIFQGQQLGIRLSHWAPTGNEADLEFADFAGYFATRPEVGAIACYIEGFKNGRTLLLAADQAAHHGVPIVCVKVGRTDEGRSMAKAHTGHLTGSDAVTSAAFRQFGVTRVDGLDELLDTAAMFARTKPPRPAEGAAQGAAQGAVEGIVDGVCVYSISGGTGAHMADMAATAGLKLALLTEETQRQLHEWIPSYLRVSNPVDNGGAPSADWRGRKILDAIVADPNVGMLICPITGALPSMGNRLAKDLVDVAATDRQAGLRHLGLARRRRGRLHTTSCSRATSLSSARSPTRSTRPAPISATTRSAPATSRRSPDPCAAPYVPPPRRGPSCGALPCSPSSSRSRCWPPTAYPSRATCSSPPEKEAVRAAEALGFPVVLKASSRDLRHKSDAGLVAVGVGSPKKVRATYAAMMEQVPDADGVLVCEQVVGGVETVVGVAHDELFGPVVMFGLGGVFVEVLRDVTFRVPPFSRNEARRMVEEVQGYPLLRGARGRPKADVTALVDVIMKVQRLAVDLHADLAELDINPLAVLPKGAVALDALAVAR